MNTQITNIYQQHHKSNRPENFSFMEKERGYLLKMNVGENNRVLDMGCRDGTLTKHFLKGNTILGIDVDQAALDKTSKNLGIKTIQMDLNGNWEELKADKFNVIVAGEVLEHLYFPEMVVKKVTQHLVTDGTFIGSVPNAFTIKHRMRYLMGNKKFTPLSDPTHINHFSINEFKKLLEKYFNRVELIGLGRYPWLSRTFPSLFAFDLFFIAKNPHES